jgi:septal ring factor EnvC (AmiA/AmiB activator)
MNQRSVCLAVLLTGALTFALAVPTAQASQAASAAKLGKETQKQLDDLSKTLNLSPDQKTKLTPMLQDEADQVKTLNADKTLSKADKDTKLKSIRTSTTEKMKSVLNEDQIKKLTDMHAKNGDWWKK